MRRGLSAVLALLILLSVLSACAEGTFAIMGIDIAEDGSLKLTWEDPDADGPYKVLFEPVSEVSADAPSGEQTVWCNSGEVDGLTYTEKYVVPDASWWFILQSASGRQVARRFDAVPGKRFAGDLGKSYVYRSENLYFTWKAEPYRRKNGSYDKAGDTGFGYPRLKEKEMLNAEEGVTYGLMITVAGVNTAFGFTRPKYVMESKAGVAANDSPTVISYGSDLFIGGSLGESETVFIPLSPFFRRVSERYGKLTGVYSLAVYIEGERALEIPVDLN